MQPSFHKVGSLALAVALAGASSSARADDCPRGGPDHRSFVLERAGNSKVSVFHLPDGIVRTIFRHGGATVLETTEFQGLFQLERIDRGRRRTQQPKTDLKAMFPLRVGKKLSVTFDTEEAGQSSTFKLEFLVKKPDTLYIGPCKYDVFQLERSESRGNQPVRFVYADYYSPELKLIIAKEYRDRPGVSSWIKYDKIYSSGEGSRR